MIIADPKQKPSNKKTMSGEYKSESDSDGKMNILFLIFEVFLVFLMIALKQNLEFSEVAF